MAGLNHISVLLMLGTTSLLGCIKKNSKEQGSSAATTSQQPIASGAQEPGPLELRQPQTKLSILDPLAGLNSVGSWRPIGRTGAPLPCPFLTKVFWGGSQMVVFGHQKGSESPSTCVGLVSLWDPLTDSWKTMPDAGPATLKDGALESAAVFLANGQLYVILQKAAESMILDLAAQSWKKAPEWMSLALWAPADQKDPIAPPSSAMERGLTDAIGEHLQGGRHLPNDVFIARALRSYVPLPSGLAIWVDTGVKIFDWQSGIAKDLPPIPWTPGGISAPGQEWLSYTMKSQILDQSVMVHQDLSGKSGSATSPSVFALTSVLSSPIVWRMISSPLLVDDQGKPKCADTNLSLATLVESRLVLVSTDSIQNEPQPVRTCISTIDTLTGAMTHTAHQTLSQIAAHNDGSYEYLDLSIHSHTLSGRRLVYRLKRDGGLVSISDDSSHGFAFQGHDERLLIYDSQSGLTSVTPPLVGSGSVENVYLIGTDRGLIAWGGHRPRPDGVDEGVSDGMVLDWPL